MAFCSTVVKYGYEDCRFEKDVDENLHSSICYNVLKEPRMCRNNEHLFCLDCITEHLRVNSQTCPECNEHLSVDTLRRARVVNNILSKLKINCDRASRGCPEFICLEELKTHDATCGYAPVLCSNAECGMVINKQEKVRHETEVCEYRRVKCHDCGQIQKDVQTLKRHLLEINENVKTTNKKMRNNHDKMKEVVGKLQDQITKEVKDVKDSLSKVNKDVDEVKVMMTQLLEKLSPTAEILNTLREDIFVAGGFTDASKSR